MVMAGENAANDVYEDVYSNDGTESDRRVIAGIKPVSLTFLVNDRRCENGTQRDHSEIGARSVLRAADEVLRTEELW